MLDKFADCGGSPQGSWADYLDFDFDLFFDAEKTSRRRRLRRVGRFILDKS